MKVLYIASNPLDENILLLEREITDLQTRFTNSSSSGVSFTFLPGLPIEKWPREISRVKPDILHISAHGVKDGLVLANQTAKRRTLTAQALCTFVSIDRPPRLIILNACNSDMMAKELVKVVPMAIGMTAETTNGAARESVRLFYERILEGQSVSNAFDVCREMIKTIDNGATNAVLCSGAKVKPEKEIFLVSPRIIARFENNYKRDSDGDFEFGLGVVGCPGNTHQVVFFTDDTDLADENDLEDSLCSVVRGTPVRGVIWVESSWWAQGNVRLFAAGVTADGEQFTTSSMMTDAVIYFYRVRTKNPNASLPPRMEEAIRTLITFDGSELDDVIATANSAPRQRASSSRTRGSKQKR
jgi:CHAT domain-containing protein